MYVKNHHFAKSFIKLGTVLCVCLRSGRRDISWNYFSFPIRTFTIKRKRKDGMSVSSCNSVNSAIMYSMEIMMKMTFVTIMISTAIMIIVFNCFQTSFKFKKQCRSLSRTYKFQKRSTKMFTICRINLDVKNLFRLLQLQN